MKTSIRTKFTLGMIFLFTIILVLSVFSGYLMNKLSNKTSAILSENYLSVVYAREMSEDLTKINQEITSSYLSKKYCDSLKIKIELASFEKSLLLEKNNLTEPGEDQLVSGLTEGFLTYRDSVLTLLRSPESEKINLYLQNKSGDLYQDLSLLSQMNGKALELKTEDAKASSKSALTQMTILATLCFLIGMSFTFSFVSYFNQRFRQLYNGIRELASSNYDQKLLYEENDEFYEISLVFNEMAESLKNNKQKLSVTLHDDSARDITKNDVDELQRMLFNIKVIEEKAAALLLRLEKK